jgi:hypothetical protein
MLVRWDKWVKMQPNTDVVYASANMRNREHGAQGRVVGHLNLLLSEPDKVNDQLPTNEMVYGLTGNKPGSGMAIPLRDLKEYDRLEIIYEDVPILIFLRDEHQVMAFDRRVNGKKMMFKCIGEQPLEFKDQTGTIWNAFGKAVRGPGIGAELKPVRGYLTEWYEWSTGTPETLLYNPYLSGERAPIAPVK